MYLIAEKCCIVKLPCEFQAKRKEEWLIEKLRKYEVPRSPEPVHDPEILTEEEKFYLKRTGEKKKNYVPVGRRGVFGGVVLNMHLHWKKHETVKVICKPCRPGQVYEYAEELTRLSKGTVIDIKPNNTIIFYRGKNYVQPKVMSPPDTLSKQKVIIFAKTNLSGTEYLRRSKLFVLMPPFSFFKLNTNMSCNCI